MNGIKSEEEPALTDMSLKCYTGPLWHLRQASRILPGCGWSRRKNLQVSASQCSRVTLVPYKLVETQGEYLRFSLNLLLDY